MWKHTKAIAWTLVVGENLATVASASTSLSKTLTSVSLPPHSTCLPAPLGKRDRFVAIGGM